MSFLRTPHFNHLIYRDQRFFCPSTDDPVLLSTSQKDTFLSLFKNATFLQRLLISILLCYQFYRLQTECKKKYSGLIILDNFVYHLKCKNKKNDSCLKKKRTITL